MGREGTRKKDLDGDQMIALGATGRMDALSTKLQDIARLGARLDHQIHGSMDGGRTKRVAQDGLQKGDLQGGPNVPSDTLKGVMRGDGQGQLQTTASTDRTDARACSHVAGTLDGQQHVRLDAGRDVHVHADGLIDAARAATASTRIQI